MPITLRRSEHLCKILRGENSEQTVYELPNHALCVFRDIEPQAPTHGAVIQGAVHSFDHVRREGNRCRNRRLCPALFRVLAKPEASLWNAGEGFRMIAKCRRAWRPEVPHLRCAYPGADPWGALVARPS